MAIAITKEHRIQAKSESKSLFQIFIDDKYVSIEECKRLRIPSGGFSVSGACTPERARELFALYLSWQESLPTGAQGEEGNGR